MIKLLQDSNALQFDVDEISALQARIKTNVFDWPEMEEIEKVNCLFKRCESPIERIFFLEILKRWPCGAITGDDCYALMPNCKEITAISIQHITRRFPDQKCRIDFVIFPSSVGGTKMSPIIGIELDGFEYHERTRSEFIKQRIRDRELQESDYKMYHFSGSEVYRGPSKVLDDVLRIVKKERGDETA